MKTFTTAGLCLIMLLATSKESNAGPVLPGKYGIYLTADDFIQHQFKHGFNKTDRNNRLVLYNMLGSSKIQIVVNGEKKVFNKKDIYGFRNDGIDYRIFNNEALAIVDTTGFIVYSKTKKIPVMKVYEEKRSYNYFSLTPNSPVLALNKSNLENSLPYKPEFNYLLNTAFKTDDDLINYDNRIKKYKLKYLYEEFEKSSMGK